LNWNNKNVLITGIYGFFAPHIAKNLISKGANVVGSYHDIKKYSFCGIDGIDELITLAYMDINDIGRVKEIISNYEIDFIFHCAAHSIVRTCVKNPVGAFSTNIMGTVNVLEAARLVGGVKGIMCMESDKSYGSFDSNNLPYKETQGIKPTNVYEVSKACSGLITDAYSNNYDMPVFTVRAANLYGPGDMNMSRLIPGSILRVLGGKSPILYSGVADYIREFLHVEDAAMGVVGLMEQIDRSRSNIFNIGSSSVHTISEVMNIVLNSMNQELDVQIIEKDPLFKEIKEQYVDYSKLQSVVSDYSARPIEEGLDDTIEWYSKHYDQLPVPS
jgi:CDP-glucose 4,6-dehydratase